MVHAEDLAEKVWIKRGWKFVKLSGRIDYLVWTEELGPVFVEVKGIKDHVRFSQEIAMTEIESMGIPCYLAFENNNFALTRWNAYFMSKKLGSFGVELLNCCLKILPKIYLELKYDKNKKSKITVDLWNTGYSLSTTGEKKINSILSQIGFFKYEVNENRVVVEMRNRDAEKYIKEIEKIFIEPDNFVSTINPIITKICEKELPVRI